MILGEKTSKRQDEIAQQVTDFIVDFIDKARERAVDPLIHLARVIVYGILATLIGITAVVTFAIVFVRFIQTYLGNIPGVTDKVWLAHLVVGIVFFLAGLIIWTKRHPRLEELTVSKQHQQ